MADSYQLETTTDRYLLEDGTGVYMLELSDRFWIAATTANWNDTANWAASSGGAGGASVPGVGDNARFDGNGIGDCTVNADIFVANLMLGAGYTGTVTLAGNVTTDSFTGTDGALDINGFTLATTGAFTCAAGFTVADTAATGIINVGGNFALNGASGAGNGIIWTDANLDVTGTATASYTTVSNSDASAGTTIDADDATNTDGGGNTNWAFDVIEVGDKLLPYQRPIGINTSIIGKLSRVMR